MKTQAINKMSVTAPISGKIIPITEVPDSVFSEKVLGDGIAIIPSDGKIYSPINGVVSSVAETLHAYGFTSDDGLDVLVHFGLETVNLKGEGFKSYVKDGDRVSVGDLVAEVDIELLKSKGINIITPVLICGGAEELDMNLCKDKTVYAVKTTLISFSSKEEPIKSETEAKNKKSGKIFDTLQKLGKVLMVVIAVMPAAGLMISLGKLVGMIGGGDIAIIHTIGNVMENIGWAVINNLHILFAVAIGGSWAKERAGGAFAAVMAFHSHKLYHRSNIRRYV